VIADKADKKVGTVSISKSGHSKITTTYYNVFWYPKLQNLNLPCKYFTDLRLWYKQTNASYTDPKVRLYETGTKYAEKGLASNVDWQDSRFPFWDLPFLVASASQHLR